jgi:hypothetical protein
MPALRYIVLHHTGFAEDHYDLMFELEPGSELTTWRLPHWPPEAGDRFTSLAKHRRDYLEYEGPISGDRGSVKRVASGHHQILESSPQHCLICLENNTTIELH